ncbi:MAG: peptidoglycan DD-metalloendopeptidase family protein [Gammaproteobacteria bacterium]|nr:peptidoglycan DD-metalloendopeptidase family protein [Gammaproteobacteria bacterium]MYJ51526.1 peptidoglycan DD-metalloendopeptidase family protein [Gammaproteobacteria bacterium]
MRRLTAILLAVSLLAGCSSSGLLSIPIINKAQYRDIPKIYRVQKGDTLYNISWAFGLDYKQVAEWNGIGPPYRLEIDQQIRLYPKPSDSKDSKPKPIVLTSLPKQEPRAAATKTTIPAKKATPTPTSAPAPGKWHWPAQGKLVGKFSPKTGNKGIQIAGAEGTPIRATTGGEVVYAGEGLRGYGKLIIIKHSTEYISAYAHNKEILVSEGQAIGSGEQIAVMGQTDTSKPMLHFEIRKGGNPIDPMKFLSQ